MLRLKHISAESHMRASDGRIYAYSCGPLTGRPHLVRQPENARWGVWEAVRPPEAPEDVGEAWEQHLTSFSIGVSSNT
jgi:hypothetical protein